VLRKAKAELKKEKEEFEKKRLASCEIAVSQGKVGGGGSDSEALTKSSEEVAKLKETLSKCETKIHEMSDETSTVQAELESCKKQQELQDQCCKDAADSAAQIASLAAAVSEG
jgi:archaellum component FlaC